MDIIKELPKEYKATPIDLKDMKHVKAGIISFDISAYDVEDIGRISILKGKAMMGLMKMDTVMVTSLRHDSPLFSYDRIHAMGNDTLIIEIYNTMKERHSYPELLNIKKKYGYLKPHAMKENWYDSLRMEESISLKDRHHRDMDELFSSYLSAFLKNVKKDKKIETEEKKRRHAVYVNGLLKEGGPSTDVFLKAIGKKKTEFLFKSILFGIE